MPLFHCVVRCLGNESKTVKFKHHVNIIDRGHTHQHRTQTASRLMFTPISPVHYFRGRGHGIFVTFKPRPMTSWSPPNWFALWACFDSSADRETYIILLLRYRMTLRKSTTWSAFSSQSRWIINYKRTRTKYRLSAHHEKDMDCWFMLPKIKCRLIAKVS